MVRINIDKPVNLSAEAKRRFWSYVDSSGGTDACWPWRKSMTPRGYGQFGGVTEGKGWMCIASRYAYQATHGRITEPLLVLHSCDNRACCNPAHLRLGTVQDNAADMVARSRQTRGSTRPLAKLTEHAVQVLEAMWQSGLYTQSQLADHFQVNQSQISRAINRKRWKHVDSRASALALKKGAA